MKQILSNLALASLAVSLFGCAGYAARQDRVDSVLASQLDVLKKIKTLREQDAVQSKLRADPLLAEQEKVLLSGLDSVIESQEAFLKLRLSNSINRGMHVN